MYSQKRALIQQIIVEYKHRKLTPFNCYEAQSDNYFFQVIKDIETALQKFVQEAKDKAEGAISFPNGFETFHPDFDYSDKRSIEGYQLRNLEKVDVVDQIAGRLDSLNKYRLYVSTDDIDAGKRYMYCYDLKEVMREFGNDLADKVEDCLNDLVELNIGIAVREFDKAVQRELKEKADFLMTALSRIEARMA